MKSTATASKSTRIENLIVLVLFVVFGGFVVRNAWLSDDAYITFRTVDNFVNGYGLTWNVAERVQVYTHPLWMFLVSAVYFATHEIFFSTLALSIVLSLVSVWLVTTQLARSTWLVCAGLAVVTLSKAFIDYATSGLENPLSHVLMAVFLVIYFKRDLNGKTYFWLALCAALAMVNRLDTMLLYAPVIAYVLLHERTWKAAGAVAVGFLPVVLWELFSLFYYGFPFPNTAYAKLTSALISRRDLMTEGLNYLRNSLNADTITLVATGLGILTPFVTREWRKLPVVAGIALYVCYVVYVGGDFMSGRFLTVPLFTAVAVLVSGKPVVMKGRQLKWPGAVLCVAVVLTGVSAPYSPVRAGGDVGARRGLEPGWIRGRSIVDERANYYHNTGLLRAFQQPNPMPDHDWAAEGRAARKAGPAVVQQGSVGFYGFFAGPEIHVIDLLALGDPLLARLPLADPDWSIGHFGRLVPEGYQETLESGENRIVDPNLALYYDKLAFVTRGDLFSGDRLREIWRLNTGAYDAYLDAYAYFRGDVFTQHYRVTNPTARPYVYVYVWNNGAGEGFLLDETSSQGRTYDMTWHITADGVRFEGDAVRQLATIGALSDAEMLNVGVLFSPVPDLAVQDIYEYRFWFRFEGDGQMTVVLPGKGFHNAAAPGGFWAHVDLGEVLRLTP